MDAYDNTTGKDGMVCACHGSVYNIEGKLVEGVVPGQGDLPAYNTSLDGKILSVEIPGLNFKVDSITLQSVTGPTQRYRLTFPTKQGARYRVRHTPDLATPPAVPKPHSARNSSVKSKQKGSSSRWGEDILKRQHK